MIFQGERWLKPGFRTVTGVTARVTDATLTTWTGVAANVRIQLQRLLSSVGRQSLYPLRKHLLNNGRLCPAYRVRHNMPKLQSYYRHLS